MTSFQTYSIKLAGNDDEEFEQPQNSETQEQHHNNQEEKETAPPPIHNNIYYQHQQLDNKEKEVEGEVVNSKESVIPSPPCYPSQLQHEP